MQVAIARPRAVVFAFVANAEAAPLWQAQMAEVRRTAAAPLGVGTTYRAQRRHRGVWLAASLAMTEYEPAHHSGGGGELRSAGPTAGTDR